MDRLLRPYRYVMTPAIIQLHILHKANAAATFCITYAIIEKNIKYDIRERKRSSSVESPPLYMLSFLLSVFVLEYTLVDESNRRRRSVNIRSTISFLLLSFVGHGRWKHQSCRSRFFQESRLPLRCLFLNAAHDRQRNLLLLLLHSRQTFVLFGLVPLLLLPLKSLSPQGVNFMSRLVPTERMLLLLAFSRRPGHSGLAIGRGSWEFRRACNDLHHPLLAFGGRDFGF